MSIYQEKMKVAYDQCILHVRLIHRRRYSYTICVSTYFLKNCALFGLGLSLWTVYAYGTIEIENPKTGHMFKVDGQRLEHFLELSFHAEESIDLVDPSP